LNAAATRFAYDDIMIFIGARLAAVNFVYNILRSPFDCQFHIVQSDIRNDIIYNVSRLFLEIHPPQIFTSSKGR